MTSPTHIKNEKIRKFISDFSHIYPGQDQFIFLETTLPSILMEIIEDALPPKYAEVGEEIQQNARIAVNIFRENFLQALKEKL